MGLTIGYINVKNRLLCCEFPVDVRVLNSIYYAFAKPWIGLGLNVASVGFAKFGICCYRTTYTRAILEPRDLWPF